MKCKYVLFALFLLLLLNAVDTFYTLRVMDLYAVPEQNALVAKTMEEGKFLLVKIGLPSLMGLFIALQIKKFSEKQLRYTFGVLKLGILFYTEINALNMLFILHYFGGL